MLHARVHTWRLMLEPLPRIKRACFSQRSCFACGWLHCPHAKHDPHGRLFVRAGFLEKILARFACGLGIWAGMRSHSCPYPEDWKGVRVIQSKIHFDLGSKPPYHAASRHFSICGRSRRNSRLGSELKFFMEFSSTVFRLAL